MRTFLCFAIIILMSSYITGQDNKLKDFFDKYDVDGSILIYDLNNNDTISYNHQRLNQEFLPASTFKIINSLIALESGAVKDENEIIKWDGKDRGYDKWNMDQTLRSAIKYSVVWAYQKFVTRMGRDTIQHFVSLANYGNENINGKLTTFWLNGELRINSYQQLDFLKNLYFNKVPFSQRNIDIVKDILIVEETGDYIFRAKTGWTMRVEDQIGWYVGYLEQNDNTYFFVTNISIKENKDAKAREMITRKVLKRLGLL